MTGTTEYSPSYCDLPRICPKKINFGSIIGHGNFCVVYDIKMPQSNPLAGMEHVFLQKNKLNAPLNKYQYGQNNKTGIKYNITASDALIRYQSRSKEPKRYYVAKLPHNDDFFKYNECYNSLKLEANILSSLNHENIIRIHGASKFDTFNYNSNEIDQKPYFILLDKLSQNLGEKIKTWSSANEKKNKYAIEDYNRSDEKYFLQTRLDILFDIACALRYLHSKQIIHRDIKPENIGFDAQGVVKVFDFGLATKFDPKLKRRNGLYKLTGGTGTCRFMCPEVAKYEHYNELADVYSYGLLMWSVLTLQVPFADYNCSQWYNHVVVGKERPSLDDDSISDIVPESIKKLMERCWADGIMSRPNFDFIENELRSISCSW